MKLVLACRFAGESIKAGIVDSLVVQIGLVDEVIPRCRACKLPQSGIRAENRLLTAA